MEAPAGGDPATLKDAQVAAFRAIAPADPAHYVRGQYDGYLDVDGVAPDSTTETYAALRLEIDNWRWAGVPVPAPHRQVPRHDPDRAAARSSRSRRNLGFFGRDIRPARAEPARGQARPVDRRPVQGARRAARRAAVPEGIELDMEFADQGGEGATPYEVLLAAAMAGNSTRFTRQDGVEETWRIMQPLLDSPPPVHPYARGSWGPEAADALTAGYARWHEPWVDA